MKTSTKKCTQCGIVKAVTDFVTKRSAPDGIGYHCKECHKKKCRKYNTQKELSMMVDDFNGYF